jgi:hypothetical protein
LAGKNEGKAQLLKIATFAREKPLADLKNPCKSVECERKRVAIPK